MNSLNKLDTMAGLQLADGGADLVLDDKAGVPITGAPDGITLDAANDKLAAQAKTHQAQIADLKANQAHTSAMQCLQHQIDAAKGDDIATLSYRDSLKDMLIQLSTLDSKAAAEKAPALLEQAQKLANARFDQMIQAGGDESAQLVKVQEGSGNAEQPYFDMPRMFDALIQDIEAQGANFSLDTIGRKHKNSELEFIKTGFSSSQQSFIEKAQQKLSRDAARRGAVNPVHVPFPVTAIAGRRQVDAAFAETYAESIETGKKRTEPTFRGDMLVPFFRPTNIAQSLGIPMLVISNDQTLPRLSASLTAAWLAENAEIADGNLTFVSATTSPKRAGVRDDISWMNLVAAASQIATIPLATSEMARAMAQLEESAVYAGTGAGGQPTGILSAAGVATEAIQGNAPTYSDMLNIQNALQDANIPDDMAKFAITSGIRKHLAQILRFPSTVGGNNRTLYEATTYSMPAGAGIQGPSGYIAEQPAYVTNLLPRATGAANNEHTLLYGDWRYVVQFSYSVAFLTIDDVSQAATGQTRITLNKFCDVFMRFPAAFVKASWVPS